jgi:hypothetical protein
MRISETEEPKSVFEKTWFQIVMLAVVVVLGIGVYWITTHQSEVAKWLNTDKTPQVEKPTVSKPTVQ